MASKKSRIATEAGSSSGRGRKRTAVIENEFGIVFKDDEQRKRYQKLEDRQVTTTRYPDFSKTLEILGIEENVTMLLNNLGWLSFLSPERATFNGLTREFLSSISLTDDGMVSFRLFNEDYRMSLYQFGDTIGFPNEGWVHNSKYQSERPIGYNRNEFWNQITGRDYYEARTAKAASIHNPVFRYLTRVMARTICGRGEMGGVRTDELFLLWAMVHQAQVNTCRYIVNNLIQVSDRSQGDIVSGGMVTFIAHKLGLGDRLTYIEQVEGNATIDLDMCILMFLVRRANESRTLFHLLIDKQKSILLPNPDRTDTRNRNNWLYLDAAGEIPQEIPVQEEEEMHEEQMQDEPQIDVQDEPHFNMQDQPQFHMQGEHQFNMQEWCQMMQGEQQRHGAEIQHIRDEQARMAGMLETMMQHFGISYPPPPPGET